ncbi:MAG: hypothetical protein ABFR36_00795 [Acidobacteriota bacterium]
MQLKHTYSKALLIILILICTHAIRAESKNLTIDFSERFRVVSWDNPVTLDSLKEDGTTFTRHRTSLGLNWKLSKNSEFYFKATNEFRIYFKPEKDFNIHEIFVDNLYLKLRNLFKLPVTLTIGRQNIMMGEGFIILDGNTYDGSRSAFFDAVRADIDLEGSGKISLFGFSAQKRDDFFPVINSRDQLLNENDIRGAGIYYQANIRKNKLDLYFLNKETDINENKTWALIVNTIGTKFNLKLKGNSQITAEAAYQYGSSKGIPIKSYGGHFHFDKVLDNKTFKKITFGGIFLSGEDSCKCKVTAWHPPFSRWPKWSDSYIYTFINEGGIAYWSNINSVYFALKTKLFRNGSLNTSLHLLRSPEKNLTTTFPGGSGNYRGALLMNRLNFKISESFSGHFLWEHFRPGNFYFNGAENYNWIRFELMYRKKIRR